MRIFLASQKCGWIKLALKLDENWKQLIYLKSGGDIGNLREKWVPNHPILKGFGKALDFLRRTFSLACENFSKANIYDTPIFPLTRRPLRTIDENFLVGGPQQFDAVSKLSKITFNNFWTGGRGREILDISQATGIQFTQEQTDKIIGMCRDAVMRYSKRMPNRKKLIYSDGFYPTVQKRLKNIQKPTCKRKGHIHPPQY